VYQVLWVGPCDHEALEVAAKEPVVPFSASRTVSFEPAQGGTNRRARTALRAYVLRN